MDAKENISKEEQAWREVRYLKKFSHALRGLYVFLETTKNIHLMALIGGALVAIILGFFFNVSGVEWMMLIFSVGFVFVTEIINTAIEIDIDLTSPEYHPYARDTKDVAAGAVLLATIVAVIIGLIIFLPKVLLYVNI